MNISTYVTITQLHNFEVNTCNTNRHPHQVTTASCSYDYFSRINYNFKIKFQSKATNAILGF